jgi:hypothetical protein
VKRKNLKKTPACQRKKGKKGVKSTRNIAELYEGEKKRQFNVTLTPTVINRLEEIANEIGESRSEVIEKTFRGEISLERFISEIVVSELSSRS